MLHQVIQANYNYGIYNCLNLSYYRIVSVTCTNLSAFAKSHVRHVVVISFIRISSKLFNIDELMRVALLSKTN